MNVLAPISTIMTPSPITVSPNDPLATVDKVFEKYKIHHLPVVEAGELVGIISKTDLLYFLKGIKSEFQEFLNKARLRDYTASEIMTTGMAKLSSTEKISVAVEVFKENLFHAIPIVDNDKLVGILTTYDIINSLALTKENA